MTLICPKFKLLFLLLIDIIIFYFIFYFFDFALSLKYLSFKKIQTDKILYYCQNFKFEKLLFLLFT